MVLGGSSMKSNIIYFPGKNRILGTEEFFAKQGIEITNLTYGQQIRKLKNFCFDRKIDLDLLEMKPFDSTDIEQQQIIQLEIYNACVCINRIRKLRKYERKEKVKSFVKRIVPVIK